MQTIIKHGIYNTGKTIAGKKMRQLLKAENSLRNNAYSSSDHFPNRCGHFIFHQETYFKFGEEGHFQSLPKGNLSFQIFCFSS